MNILFEFYPQANESHCVGFSAKVEDIDGAKALLSRMIPHVTAGGRQITAASAFFEANSEVISPGSLLTEEPDRVIMLYDLEDLGPQASCVNGDNTEFLGPLHAFLSSDNDYQAVMHHGATVEPHQSAFVG